MSGGNAPRVVVIGSGAAGLSAAGNAAAATTGPGIISPGATIGSALTWGWIAGTSITAITAITAIGA
ncbi:hypothetical protein [Streptosporangium saharense]|uniref:hypothetical protein n=1 Tax=Streptosporangium saharense TaxID=1706840 RepID=UPI00341FC61F